MAAETPSPASKEKTGGDPQKDAAGNFTEWAAAMQAAQAFYKAGPPGAGHPGSYYAPSMAPPPHPYMWGAQPMMNPYGGPAPSPYYGAMYPQQHPMGHPPPASYAYAAPVAGQAKEGAEAAAAGSAPAAAPASALDASNTEANSSGNSDTPSLPAHGSSAPNGGPTPAYPYTPGNPEMWAVGAPLQRSRSSGAIGTDAAALPFQDEREVKRQRRKQSNRESARRSRLRKQAECEDLGSRVANLVAENNSMHTEVTRLQERCARLTSENAALVEQAKAAGLMVVDLSGPPKATEARPAAPAAVIAPESKVSVLSQPAVSEEVAKVAEASVATLEKAAAVDLKTELPAESLQSVITSQILVPAA